MSPSLFGVGNSVGNTLMVSHRLSINNTLIFCGADMDQLLIIGLVFIWFKGCVGSENKLGQV